MASGIELATAYVNLTVSAKDIGPQVSKQFGGVEKQADKAGKSAGKKFSGGIGSAVKGLAGVMAGAFAGAAVVAGFKSVIGAASELEQSVGGVQAVFGKSSGEIEKASKAAASNIGLSRDAYNKLATTLGAGLKNKGIEDYAGSTQKLISIGGDLAAQFGGSTQEAVEALSSAMRGESDPIEKYGVALNETAVNAKLAEMGVKKSGGTYTEQQKTMARLALITEQTKDAQGAFGREGETAAGRQAKLSAAMDNIKASIGTALLPAFSGVVNKISDFATGIDQGTGAGGAFRDRVVEVKDRIAGLIQGFKDGTGAGGQIRDVFTGIKDAVMGVVDWVTRYKDILMPLAGGILAVVAAIKIWSAITKAFAAVQLALNIVMSANPIGIIILAIVALVAAIVIAYKKNEAFRDLVNKVWAAIKGAILAVVDWFKNTAWPWMRDALESIKAAFEVAKTKIAAVWAGIKSAIGAAWDWIRANVFDRITSALAALKDRFVAAKDNVVAAWGLLKTGLQAVYTWVKTNVFDKLVTAVEAIKGKFSTAVSAIGTAWDAVKALAKAPVKFIIDTVLNNGLIGGFNWLSGKIGGPTVPRISIPGFARGGVLPGYTPGRDVHRFISPTGGILDLSGGEAIMRPEWTRAMGGAPGVARQNAMARAGTLPSQAFAGGGVLGWIKGKAKGAFDWMSDKAGAIFSALSSPAGYLKDKVSGLFGGMPDGAKMPAEYGKAMVGKGVAAAAEKIKALFESFKSAFAQAEDTGGSFGGGVGMGYKAQVAWAKANIPWAAITSTVRTGNPASDHDKGRAIDLAGGNMGRIFDAIKSHFSIPSIKSLYYSPKGASQVRFGKVSNTPPHIFNTHWDHVHWAMANGGVIPKPLLFDRGGVLPTGTSLVHNGTGAPEPLARVGGDGVRLHPEDIDLLAAAIRRGASDGISGLAGRVGSYAPVGRF